MRLLNESLMDEKEKEKEKDHLKDEAMKKENILLSNYHTGELLLKSTEEYNKYNDKNDDISSSSSKQQNLFLTITHPHTPGPISLFIFMRGERNRNRFKLTFNSLRGSSLQMMDYWKKNV